MQAHGRPFGICEDGIEDTPHIYDMQREKANIPKRQDVCL